jgi:hypothetical protein
MPLPPPEKRPPNRPFWKRALRVTGKVLAWLFAIPILLVLLVGILIYVPPIQNFIRGKAVDYLEKETGTHVELEHFNLRFPLGLTLEGFQIDDLHGDTLLRVGALKANVHPGSLIRQRIVISHVTLEGGRAYIHQDPDSVFNFDFLVDAFATPDTVAKEQQVDTTKTDAWKIIIEEINVEDLLVRLDLEPSEMALDMVVGKLGIDFDNFSLDPEQIHLHLLELHDSRIHLRMASNGDPPDPDTYPYLENPMKDHDIRFSEFLLRNIEFTMKDVTTGDSMWVSLGELEIDPREMRLKEQRVEFERFTVDDLHFGMLVMAGEEPDEKADTLISKVADPPWLDKDDGFRYFIRDWRFQMDEFRIRNSSIAIHNDSISEPQGLFDADHMVFNDINVVLDNVELNNQHIALMLDEFSTRTTPDQPDVLLTLGIDARPDEIRLHDGQVAVGENALSFDLTASLGDLSTAYGDPQKIPLRFRAHSELQLSRLEPLLAAFDAAPPREFIVDETWTTGILVQGNIHEIDTIRLDLVGDKGSVIHLNGMVHGAQDWPNTTFRLELAEFTMGQGMREIMRAQMPDEVDLPQRLTMRANASGSHGAVRADLAMDSDAGKITVNAAATGITNKYPDSIDLTADITDLQTHRFTGDTAIGNVSLGLRAEGQRLNTRAREGYIRLDPRELVVNGIDLADLELEGNVRGDSVDLVIGLATEPASIALEAYGTWPDENDTLRLGIDLLVDHLHLEELGLMEHPLGVEGHWRGNAAFHTGGMGHFRLNGEGLRIFNDERDFVFEEFLAKGYVSEDSTAFDLFSDAVNLEYHTNIHPDSLVTDMQGFLTSIIQDDTSFIATPGKRMELNVTLPRTAWLTEIILPDLDAIDLDHFTGHYDSDLDELRIDLYLPYLMYGKIEVDELVVDLNARDNAINGLISVERIDQDSLRIERLRINASTSAGVLTTVLRMEDIEGDKYRIGTVLRTIDNIRELRVQENLVLNNEEWTIHGDNVLRFPDDGPTADNFVMSRGEQQVELTTPPERLVIDFTRFQLTTITDLVSTLDTVPLIAGVLDGTVSLPRSDQALLRADLSIADLHALGTEIGLLTISAEETASDRYAARARLQHEVNRFDLTASIDTREEQKAMDVDGDLAFEDLRFLKPFVSDYLYKLEGGLDGTMRIRQRGDDLAMNGELTFENAGIGLIMTGATYRLPDETVTFDNKGIHFDAFNLVDSAGNRFQLDGNIDHAAAGGPELKLRLRTDRFQFVNSTYEDNQSFYGDLYTAMDLRINGSFTEPSVDGLISILEGTYMSIVLPGGGVEMISHEGIVVFTDDYASLDTLVTRSDGEILQDSLQAQMPGIDLDLNIKIAPEATFAIVMNPVTGDAATVSAEADLNFRFGGGRDMFLSGPLTIQGGGYTLNFYGLVRKEFELVKGGTVLWDGEPTKARLDIQARLIANTAPYPLVANAAVGMSDAERNRLQARLPFEVLIGVGGNIEDPRIDFGLDLPRMIRNSYPQVDTRLQQLSQPAFEEELNRQVFAVLVLNTFIMDDPGSSPGGGRSLAGTAARNSVNQILSDQLNKLAGNYLGGVDISVGVQTYDQAHGDQAYQRTTVDYQLSKRVLDDRLTFEVGGSVGVDEQATDVSAASSTRRAQYAIMYDLTPDGRYRLRGFHENAFDLYDGEITRSGLAILYTKEFEENARARQKRRQEILRRAEGRSILPGQDADGGGGRERRRERDREPAENSEDEPEQQPQ